jgi:hypothetical protein
MIQIYSLKALQRDQCARETPALILCSGPAIEMRPPIRLFVFVLGAKIRTNAFSTRENLDKLPPLVSRLFFWAKPSLWVIV